ncbi:hypothetical protein SCOR_08545 [Sulfidibacter corallicola]
MLGWVDIRVNPCGSWTVISRFPRNASDDLEIEAGRIHFVSFRDFRGPFGRYRGDLSEPWDSYSRARPFFMFFLGGGKSVVFNEFIRGAVLSCKKTSNPPCRTWLLPERRCMIPATFLGFTILNRHPSLPASRHSHALLISPFVEQPWRGGTLRDRKGHFSRLNRFCLSYSVDFWIVDRHGRPTESRVHHAPPRHSLVTASHFFKHK